MIEQVVALLMFVNGEIKEHRIQEKIWQDALEANVMQKEITVQV